MKTFKELVEKFKDEEGNINFEEGDKAYQKHINDVVAAKTDESKILPKAVEKIAGELGVEASSVDDLKTYIKKMGGNTDEIKEENIKLQKELDKYKNDYEETLTAKQELENEFKTKTQLDMIKSLGVDDDRADYLHYKLSKKVDEDNPFDKVLETYKEENADEFRKRETTGRRFPKSNENFADDDFNAAHERLYSKK
jgi:hypothetical protein